ncbi:MAG TPA: post-transcriptional regulator [Candidatus Pseudogracilibacillus intestinigallinarum]|uniref:Post-transcriptional regulator n=1 Tax=Candidatus Pseudogracilibacillus intestinigallinarum TaxID=2838742 RepID=A0A9D1TK15_9BACI|nr:post-transcriptional regulator [Candidatus Pseudogracilibacillus intestinigallinarum]
MERKHVREWKKHVYPALKSKESEFRLIGYNEITVDELWRCLMETIWKKNPEKYLHEIIQDIFHLPASTYMNFITVNALKVDDSDLMASIQAVTNNEQP